MDYQYTGCWSWKVLSSLFEKPFVCYMWLLTLRGTPNVRSWPGGEWKWESTTLSFYPLRLSVHSQPAEFLKLLLWELLTVCLGAGSTHCVYTCCACHRVSSTVTQVLAEALSVLLWPWHLMNINDLCVLSVPLVHTLCSSLFTWALFTNICMFHLCLKATSHIWCPAQHLAHVKPSKHVCC